MARKKGGEPMMRRAARSLATDIMRGRYPTGSRIPVEADLAADLGVGRSTVREAIKVLASKGMVQVAPRSGTVVRPESDWYQLDRDLINWRFLEEEGRVQFMLHLEELRVMFEPYVAKLAAKRRTDAQITAISQALSDMKAEAKEDSAVIDAAISFYEAVSVASGNPLLAVLGGSLATGLRNALDVMHDGAGWVSAGASKPYQLVADAIIRQEPDAAAAAARALLELREKDRKRADRATKRPMPTSIV